MKFQNIREFITLLDVCQHCGQPLSTKLSGKKTPNFLPKYNMDFGSTKFFNTMELDVDNAFKKSKATIYSSTLEDNHLIYQYEMSGQKHNILSIDIDTNQIVGDLDRVQKVFWDNYLALSRECNNKACIDSGKLTVYLSSLFVLERKALKLFPFFLNVELLSVAFNDKIFGLMTVGEINQTFLMASKEVIKKFPPFHLYKIKGSETICNKIQTLVNFS